MTERKGLISDEERLRRKIENLEIIDLLKKRAIEDIRSGKLRIRNTDELKRMIKLALSELGKPIKGLEVAEFAFENRLKELLKTIDEHVNAKD